MASPIFAGLVILMLGDSHFATQGYLATTLGDALIAQGAKVQSEAACGAPVSIWVAGGLAPCGAAERIQSGPLKTSPPNKGVVPSLATLAAQVHPNLIIVGSGDTMAGYAQPTFSADYVEQQISGFTRVIRQLNIPCVWIGPGWGNEGGPYFKNFARAKVMSDFLATHVAPCRYIDSQKMAQPGEWPTFDGQHYTAVGYQKWALAIDAELTKLAQTPP
jgi:hypothetical protein